MNIIYITNLSTNISSGLNWSVPATVNAQSKIDNVLWLNLTNTEMNHWKEVKAFHRAEEFRIQSNSFLDNLPAPFNHPDIVVFEGFYHIKDPFIAKKLKSKGIPYIVVPRGSLTCEAQHGNILKTLKKKLANLLIFRSYTRNALAIQYLTAAECVNSGLKWNRNTFIIPNGFKTPFLYKKKFSKNGLKAVFIGRLDLHHKGLDILLEACNRNKTFLLSMNFSFAIYGPKRYDYLKIKDFIETNNLNDIIALKGEISGKDKENVLLNSDLFVLTSRFEGHPMGLVEAIAYGIPVLVTPGSNMADEINESDAGWVADTSVESVGQILHKIIAERSDLQKKSAAARKLSMVYNWDYIAHQFHNELERYLSKDNNMD